MKQLYLLFAAFTLCLATHGYKRGVVAIGIESCSDLAALAPGVSWYYTYQQNPGTYYTDCAATLNLEFVPMQKTSKDISTLRDSIPPGSVSLLGFNEPNSKAQSDLTPKQAADLWKSQVMPQIQGLGLRIGTPSAITGRTPDPFVWFAQFFHYCTGCHFDFITTHYYGRELYQMIDYLTRLNEQFKMPIWLTEFARPIAPNVNDSTTEVEFMQQAVSWLENTPWIERYAWFAARQDGSSFLGPAPTLLANGEPSLTQSGQAYVSLPYTVPDSTSVTSSTNKVATSSTTLRATSSTTKTVTSTSSASTKATTTTKHSTSSASTSGTASVSKAHASTTSTTAHAASTGKATTSKVSTAAVHSSTTAHATATKASTSAAHVSTAHHASTSSIAAHASSVQHASSTSATAHASTLHQASSATSAHKASSASTTGAKAASTSSNHVTSVHSVSSSDAAKASTSSTSHTAATHG